MGTIFHLSCMNNWANSSTQLQNTLIFCTKRDNYYLKIFQRFKGMVTLRKRMKGTLRKEVIMNYKGKSGVIISLEQYKSISELEQIVSVQVCLKTWGKTNSCQFVNNQFKMELFVRVGGNNKTFGQ